jgi:hypothetical protein
MNNQSQNETSGVELDDFEKWIFDVLERALEKANPETVQAKLEDIESFMADFTHQLMPLLRMLPTTCWRNSS